MGKEEDYSVPNHQRRLMPAAAGPALSVPGAHHAGGPGDPTTRYSKSYHPSCSSGKETMGKGSSSRSIRTAGMEDSDSSVDGSNNLPATIPLESDYFYRRSPTEPRKRDVVIPIVLMALIAVLATVIPTSVILARKEAAPYPHNQAEHAYSPPPPPYNLTNLTLAQLQALVPNATEATLQRIGEDPSGNSPQALALRWIEIDPNDWSSYEDWRKVQRFAMAVLFYAMGGPGWGGDWTSHHLHECDWMKRSRFRAAICNDKDRFVQAYLPGFSYLRGALPPEIALLDHLETIHFAKSKIGKNLDHLFSRLDEDDWSAYLPSLETLILEDTMLTGTIPPSLASLTQLQHLDLSQNDLTGTIPSLLLDAGLVSLDLSENELTGTIPASSSMELDVLLLQENRLEPALPPSLCNTRGGSSFPMSQLETDWCSSYEECCNLAP